MTDETETTMALLRECLQALRTKQGEWDVPATGWPQPRPGKTAGALPQRPKASDSQRLAA
jgi:hypothetical protein